MNATKQNNSKTRVVPIMDDDDTIDVVKTRLRCMMEKQKTKKK